MGRMRIHNAAGHLDKFPDVRDKQNRFYAKLQRHIQRLPDVVAALHGVLRPQQLVLLLPL